MKFDQFKLQQNNLISLQMIDQEKPVDTLLYTKTFHQPRQLGAKNHDMYQTVNIHNYNARDKDRWYKTILNNVKAPN